MQAYAYRRFIMIGLVAGALIGCDDGVSDPPPRPTITLTPTTAEVQVGAQRAFTAALQNANGRAEVYTWRVVNPAVAQVNVNGVVTGLAPGATQLEVLLQQDTTVRATAQLTVVPPSDPVAAPDTLPVLGFGAVPGRFTGEVAVRGDWAYTSTWGNRNGAPGNAIKIWNVSGNTPVLTDSLIITGASTTGDVQISDDGALLVVATEFNPGSIVVYNRANPARPVQLSRFSSPNTGPGVHTVKLGRVASRHYAFLSVNPGISGARLVIVDITDPAAPTEVWAQVMGRPYVHDVFVRDGILMAALWHDGLRIFDIGGGGRGGTPSAPVVMGNLVTAAGNIHNIWWFHDPTNGSKRYVFLGEEGPGGVNSRTASGDIHVIDVSDMSNPRQVGHFGVTGAGTHNFWMDEPSGILYAAYYNGGVRALDVRGDLSNCTEQQKTMLGFCSLRLMSREVGVSLLQDAYVWGVVHQGTHVFASDMARGLFKLDASRLKR
jgi:hypothetical protein